MNWNDIPMIHKAIKLHLSAIKKTQRLFFSFLEILQIWIGRRETLKSQALIAGLILLWLLLINVLNVC